MREDEWSVDGVNGRTGSGIFPYLHMHTYDIPYMHNCVLINWVVKVGLEAKRIINMLVVRIRNEKAESNIV